MNGIELLPDVAALDLARECLYRFLAAALSDPRGPGWSLLSDPDSRHLAAGAADLLREEADDGAVTPGLGEVPPDRLDLTGVLHALDRPAVELRAAYDRTFGLVMCRECPPYETEYHASAEPFFRAQQLADVAGFYRAFGLDVSARSPERPDHVGLELEFMAFVLMKKREALAGADPVRAAVCDEAERTFFRDHLAWWAPAFCQGLRRKAGEGLLGAAANVLAAFLPVERARLGVPAPRLPLRPAASATPEEPPGRDGCQAGGATCSDTHA